MGPRILVATAWVAATCSAQAVFFELEPNNSRLTANQIVRPSGTFADVGLASLTSGDMDFFKINLIAGETLTAITTPLSGATQNQPDTWMTLFDASGSPLISNDDAGSGVGSAFSYRVLATGTYTLGITGYEDPQFQGFSGQEGQYTLTVSVVPEPASMLVLSAGIAAMLRRKRRAASR